MATTTTTRHKRRRAAAILLVGLGITSLGVASASHLNVTAQGDLVASGVVVPNPTSIVVTDADVTVKYNDVSANEAATLATKDNLPVAVALTLKATDTFTKGSAVRVYFYKDKGTTPVAKAEVSYDSTVASYDITQQVLVNDALPVYDRVAVVAQSVDYK